VLIKYTRAPGCEISAFAVRVWGLRAPHLSLPICRTLAAQSRQTAFVRMPGQADGRSLTTWSGYGCLTCLQQILKSSFCRSA
jgi:hypothetical protein